jgi:L-iditol 2-dehydrogenase
LKAVRLYGPNDLRVESVDITPIASSEVRVQVKAAGICGSDLHIFSGKLDAKNAGLPEKAIMGHEFSGVISQVGSDVRGLRIGDAVAVHPQIFCGKCYYCKKGQFIFCKEWTAFGYRFPGGFAEYVNVRASNIRPKPENLSFEEVALLDPLTCGLHGVHLAGIAPSDSVAIIGSGTIGLAALTCSKAVGAKRVYAIDFIEDRLNIAKEMGVDECVNPRKEDPVQKMMDLTDGDGVDVVLEAVGGSTDTIPMSMKMVRSGGKVVYLGWFTEPKLVDLRLGQQKEVRLIPSWVWGFWNGTDEFDISLDMLSNGKVDVKRMITHRYPLKDITKALEVINKKGDGVIKVILNP